MKAVMGFEQPEVDFDLNGNHDIQMPSLPITCKKAKYRYPTPLAWSSAIPFAVI